MKTTLFILLGLFILYVAVGTVFAFILSAAGGEKMEFTKHTIAFIFGWPILFFLR